MGERLCRARGASSRRDSQRDQQAGLAVLHPHHQPLCRRTAAVPAQRHDGEQGKRALRDRQGGAKRMIAGLPLSFAEPFLLLGLLSLPVLWWILRLIPPRPRRVEFPPTRLLFDIKPKEDTPARTPWWLTLLRLLLATLVILAAAGPLWNPPVATTTGATPVALLIDNGFGAAATWDARLRTADDIVARAEADNRGVAIVPLGEATRDISVQLPAAARVRIK